MHIIIISRYYKKVRKNAFFVNVGKKTERIAIERSKSKVNAALKQFACPLKETL